MIIIFCFRDYSSFCTGCLAIYLLVSLFAICLLKGYYVFRIVLPWASVISMFLSSVPSIRSVIVSSIVFVWVIVILVIGSVPQIVFLFIKVYNTPVMRFTYWHSVFFKPLFFFQKLLYGVQLYCLTLFTDFLSQILIVSNI